MQQGQAELVLKLLARRFEVVPPRLADRVRAVPSAQMPDLLDVALEAGSLAEVSAALDGMLAGASNGRAA
jgi:hypothetical protein